MTHDRDAMRTPWRFRPNPFAVVAALLGAAAFAAALAPTGAMSAARFADTSSGFYGGHALLFAPLVALLRTHARLRQFPDPPPSQALQSPTADSSYSSRAGIASRSGAVKTTSRSSGASAKW